MFIPLSHFHARDQKAEKHLCENLLFPLSNLPRSPPSVDRCSAKHPLTGSQDQNINWDKYCFVVRRRMKCSHPPHNRPRVCCRQFFFFSSSRTTELKGRKKKKKQTPETSGRFFSRGTVSVVVEIGLDCISLSIRDCGKFGSITINQLGRGLGLGWKVRLGANQNGKYNQSFQSAETILSL